jgi:hypothetical protein
MTEYPSIMNSSKAPRGQCVGFVKFDGSNFRAKYTQKQGFASFGSRHELIDESHKFLGESVTIFKRDYAKELTVLFKKDEDLRNEREIMVFAEFYGAKSFAGIHDPTDKKELTVIDVLVGHKNHWFYKPYEFIETFQSIVKIPPVLYTGNLNDKLIEDVRTGVYTPEFHRLTDNKFPLFEGIVCKGTMNRGDFCGKMWSAKIKTNEYFAALKNRWGDEGIKKYGE